MVYLYIEYKTFKIYYKYQDYSYIACKYMVKTKYLFCTKLYKQLAY